MKKIKVNIDSQFYKANYSESILKDTPLILGDSLSTIWEVWEYIEIVLQRKIRNYPLKIKEFKKLKEDFLKLYVWTQAKKENIKNETKVKATEPFYYIKMSNKSDNSIWERLRTNRYKLKFKLW